MSKDVIWRSFAVPLDLLVEEGIYDDFEELRVFLTKKLQQQLKTKKGWAAAKRFSHLSAGDFRNKHNIYLGSPSKKWDGKIKEKAKYWRSVQEQIRTIVVSVSRRERIAKILEDSDWDLNEARTILTQEKLFPTNLELNNIIRSEGIIQRPVNVQGIIDYTVQDTQTIVRTSEEKLFYRIRIFDDWVNLTIPVPKHLRDNVISFSKPKIRKDKNTGRLMVDTSYKVEVDKASNIGRGILGVDLGLAKKFSGSVVYPDCSFSPELLPSRELEKLEEKLSVLKEEIFLVRARAARILPYIEDDETGATKKSYEKCLEEVRLLKRKRTLIKEHSAWVAARDIVGLARTHGAGVIHLENLKFVKENKKSGFWDYSRTQDLIEEIAELYGIRVEIVSAAYTSQTDPWLNSKVEPTTKRRLKTSKGNLDRDRVASLNIALREPYSRKKKGNKKPFKPIPLKNSGPVFQKVKAKGFSRRKTRIMERIIVDSGSRVIVAGLVLPRESLKLDSPSNTSVHSGQTIISYDKL